MTEQQKELINQKDGNGLKTQISILEATNHKDKAKLIAYCELRLDRLNRGEAMLERSEPDKT